MRRLLLFWVSNCPGNSGFLFGTWACLGILIQIESLRHWDPFIHHLIIHRYFWNACYKLRILLSFWIFFMFKLFIIYWVIQSKKEEICNTGNTSDDASKHRWLQEHIGGTLTRWPNLGRDVRLWRAGRAVERYKIQAETWVFVNSWTGVTAYAEG